MAAAARAEARRKAILSRGTDRLAKLTTSARGEDAPAYLHDDPPLVNLPSTSAQSFLGEASSNMPTPRRPSASPSPAPPPKESRTTPSRNANLFEGTNGIVPDPSVWLPEQQQQFMQALMNASGGAPFPQSSPIGEPYIPLDPSLPPMDNPFAALLGPQAGAGAGAGMFPPFGPGMAGKVPEEAKPKTKLQKALPLLHLIAMWCLLAYFVLWAEPKAFSEATGEDVRVSAVGLFKRWAALGTQSPVLYNANEMFRIHVVPFFWAFTTLQIALHSLRIFSGFDAVQPPTLVALALPHLPPPLPSLIVNGMKYMQMGSLFLDDLSGLVVGMGFIMYFSGWISTVD
ncbi:hypothetical protein M413DRAFT_12419 [Hebeloma cylindrosporum]|uniref:Uncharacterized protein n=1 Tax=Hebeloma cylindrosporum TaxID=76867 RepID=A0A0C3C4G0_HEBCY|nr:hypothetical protein M413DRAFT_12419 [Hebeloma cylindrosporum h7]